MKTRPTGLFIAVIYLIVGSLLPGLAWGQDAAPIGKVLNASGAVTLEHTGPVVVQAKLATGAGPVSVGDLVYQGDIVQTGADGALGIVFGDGTSFDISSNARMELNEFIYDPKGSSNSTLFNLKKGTFTFLAGNVAKTGNMRVETPVGTMGIRGTAPRVEILDDGAVRFTTLIEENKTQKPGAAAPAQRAAQDSTEAAKLRAERELTRKLNICRGC